MAHVVHRAISLLLACGGCTQYATYDFDSDGTEDRSDCVPDDAGIHPGATDTGGDGIDENCDGVDGTDGDGDGHPSEYDCADADPVIHPGATDEEGDDIDQDCDGVDGVGGVRPGDVAGGITIERYEIRCPSCVVGHPGGSSFAVSAAAFHRRSELSWDPFPAMGTCELLLTPDWDVTGLEIGPEVHVEGETTSYDMPFDLSGIYYSEEAPVPGETAQLSADLWPLPEVTLPLPLEGVDSPMFDPDVAAFSDDVEREGFALDWSLADDPQGISLSIQGFHSDGSAYGQWIRCLGSGSSGETFDLPQLLEWETETDILIYLGSRRYEEPVLPDGSHLQVFVTSGLVGSARLHR